MNRIGILYHPLNESARQLARELGDMILSKGLLSWLCSAWEKDEAIKMIENTDLILCVGGDGTILRAAQVALINNVPITGINMGTLGFMTELTKDEVGKKILDIIDGQGWIDERAMLEVQLPGQPESHYFVLNDVVLARGAVARMVSIDVNINGMPFNTYRADGVIISTATGSTGYNLAAGGPVVHFKSSDFILTPIVAHLGPPYSLVLPPETVVGMQIKTSFPATLSIDGHINRDVSGGTEVTVRHSSRVTRFLRLQPSDYYYRSLQMKLR